MGSSTILLSICAVVLMLQWCEAVNPRCPSPERVYAVKANCRDDNDCRGGQVCCPNQGRTLSCAEPAPQHLRDSYDYKNNNKNTKNYKGNNYNSFNNKRFKRANIRSQSGPGTYCGQVKCMPFQKCIRNTNGKLVCRR